MITTDIELEWISLKKSIAESEQAEDARKTFFCGILHGIDLVMTMNNGEITPSTIESVVDKIETVLTKEKHLHKREGMS